MRVWILHVGEELPVDERPRLFRYGHLAEELCQRGHDVLRWAPTFQHFRKRQRFDADRRVEIAPGYAIQFVHAPGYARNVSVARWRSYRALGRRLGELVEREPRPDLIVTGIPSLEWCEVAAGYGRRRGVPVVLDVRDLWPDIYLQMLPAGLRSAGRWAIGPLVQRAQRMCRDATALCGVSQSYLDWGLAMAGREKSPQDRVFPLGYQPPALSPGKLAAQVDDLKRRGVDTGKTICVFIGLIERCYDVESIVTAARLVEQQQPGRYQFVICGDGSRAARLARQAAGVANVRMLGWVDPATIAALMSVSAVGLAAYSAGAPQSLPNKPFEYMAGGLAIVNSLPGELPALLAEHQCGTTYRAGDAASLAAAITALAADPAQLAAMQARSRHLFESRFRVDQIRAELADYLEALEEVSRPWPLLQAA